MPKNWNRNCPAKSVRPTGASADQGRHGRDEEAQGGELGRRERVEPDPGGHEGQAPEDRHHHRQCDVRRAHAICYNLPQ
jgi:hypothetical protein